MADVDDTYEVLKYYSVKGGEYINTNKTVSMVFNIYNQKSLLLLASWSPYDRRTENTIDRFLENSKLSGLYTVLPFLVRQSLDVKSSLWTGVEDVNRLYDVMIHKSEANLFFKLRIMSRESPQR